MTTYQFIKALPAKSNWSAIHNALRELVSTTPRKVFDEASFSYAGQTGVRADRSTAMEMACDIIHSRSVKAKFIPPSPETLAWGGFLGGENVVWTDSEAEEMATVEVIEAIKKVA